MLCYPLCLFQSHAVVCGCPPTEECDAIQTLKCSHERTVQLTQPVSLFKHLYFDSFYRCLSLKIKWHHANSVNLFPVQGWSERTHH